MWLEKLTVKNFRSLQEIRIDLNQKVNVIVGPNAVGKSTVLEAIRFAKSVCAPRTAGESNQTLQSLRAATPHLPQKIIAEGLTPNPKLPVEVECLFHLTDEELQLIGSNIPQIATFFVQSGTNFGGNVAAFSVYISSDEGKEALKVAETNLSAALTELAKNRTCRLAVKIDFSKDRMETGNVFDIIFFRFLEQRLPLDISLFSYFPADRALPPGEIPIQIGLQDAMAQLESHNSQPHTKYARAKNTVFNSVIMSDETRKTQLDNFQTIFDGLLHNRQIVGPSVNPYGMLTITVQDTETGRTFDIDAMSSGEKNLVLTWLLVARSMTSGGIVLLDEPELHLNPAICKHILPFIIKNYVEKKNIQIIMCSHSPPILAGAVNRSECKLFHIRSGKSMTEVRPQDREELTEALRLLGTSEMEGLLYDSTIFVEGPHDLEVLDEGFGRLLRRHMIKDLGGRSEIEKRIAQLLKEERAGAELTPKYFIFDRDNKPTDLAETKCVRFLQWDRRCLENYLLDTGVITDILKGCKCSGQPITSMGQVEEILRTLAMEQLFEVAAREVYQSYNYVDPCLRAGDIGKQASLTEISRALFKRIEDTRNALLGLEEGHWKEKFICAVTTKKEELTKIWETKWQIGCDGKLLFSDLQQKIQINRSLLQFKKQIIAKMQQNSTPLWNDVHDKLCNLIK